MPPGSYEHMVVVAQVLLELLLDAVKIRQYPWDVFEQCLDFTPLLCSM